jgi:hypothetical protein
MPIDLTDAESLIFADVPSLSRYDVAFAPGRMEGASVLTARSQRGFDTVAASPAEAKVGDATYGSRGPSVRGAVAVPLP